MKKVFSFLWRHKIIFLIVLTALIGGGYFFYQKSTRTQADVSYVTAAAAKGILISAISGTGQVSASNQVDVSPKVSGTVVAVNLKNGQEVKEGDLLARIDSRDAIAKVNEAKSSLETAELDLEELLAPADNYTLMQAENSVADAQDSLAKLKINQQNDQQRKK